VGVESVGEPVFPFHLAVDDFAEGGEAHPDGVKAVVPGDDFELGDGGGDFAFDHFNVEALAVGVDDDDVLAGGEELADEALAAAVAERSGFVEVVDGVFDEGEIAGAVDEFALGAEAGGVATGGADGGVFDGEADMGEVFDEPGGDGCGPVMVGAVVGGDGTASEAESDRAGGEFVEGAGERAAVTMEDKGVAGLGGERGLEGGAHAEVEMDLIGLMSPMEKWQWNCADKGVPKWSLGTREPSADGDIGGDLGGKHRRPACGGYLGF